MLLPLLLDEPRLMLLPLERAGGVERVVLGLLCGAERVVAGLLVLPVLVRAGGVALVAPPVLRGFVARGLAERVVVPLVVVPRVGLVVRDVPTPCVLLPVF